MRSVVRSGLVALLTLSVAAVTGCAAQPEDDGDSQSDAISSQEAAKEWAGSRQILTSYAATTRSVKELGIATWDAYLIKTSDLDGIVFFGVGRDGHVRHALVSGESSNGKPIFALVNYDVAGKTAPTEADRDRLRTIAAELPVLRAGIRVELSQRVADASQRVVDASECMVNLAVILVGLVAIAPVVILGAAEVAVVGAAMAWVSNGIAVAGAGILGFQAGDLINAAKDRTGCFVK